MLRLYLCILRYALQKVKIHGNISLWLHHHHNPLVFLPTYFSIKAGDSHLTFSLPFEFQDEGSSLESSKISLKTALTWSVYSHG